MKKREVSLDLKNNQQGSALVLVIMLLVSALLVVSSITTISALERKNSEKAKNSAPSFQSADAGIEWVLGMTANAKPDESIASIFGSVDCSAGTGGLDCEVYFVDDDFKVISDYDTEIGNVSYVRSVGYFGEGDLRVSRALETSLVLSREPIGLWKLDQDTDSSGGAIIDSSEGGFDGTDQGAIDFFVGSPPCDPSANSCALFSDSEPDFVSVSDDSALDFSEIDNFTITAWFRHDSSVPSDVEYIISKTDGLHGYAIYYDDNGHVVFAVQDDSPDEIPAPGVVFHDWAEDEVVADNFSLGDDSWHFVAATWNASDGEMQLQVDGDLFSNNTPKADSSFENDGDLLIGALYDSSASSEDYFFNGYLDDVRVYDYALTENQIMDYASDGPS